MKYLLFLCLCFGCKAPLNIIDLKTSVHGTIVDEKGKLISNVRVQVAHTKVDFNTGSNKDFVLLGVTKDITLMFECEGYVSQAITCSPGCDLKIRLFKNDSLMNLPAVKHYWETPTY